MQRSKSPKTRTGKVRVRRGGRIYTIPVENGVVPLWALAQRFQELGTVDDLDSDSSIVLPSGCTPEELIEWWVDPSSCDIQGVDTRDSPMYDVSSVPRSKRAAQRKMAVIADPEEARRIRRILSESFTTQELETMAADGSVVIRAVPYCGDATGCYYRRQDGVEIPLIVLERKTTPDGVVHEFVHHLRAVDTSRHGMLRTSFPTDADGRLSSRFGKMSRRQRERIVEQEERATVAETIARTGSDPVHSGYYDRVEGKNPRKAYVEDLHTVTGTDPKKPESEIPRLKGKAARVASSHGYEYTNIARTSILSRSVKKR